jgi:hypothetical protein
MLQKYITREQDEVKVAITAMEKPYVNEVEFKCSNDMFIPLKQTETWKDVKICPKLSAEEKQEIETLLHKYQDRLNDLPGSTSILKCEIQLTEDTPFRTRTYPVPFAMRDTIKKELELMKSMDIIEPSTSQHISPPVIVKKPDGSNRFCIDYRKLNAVTKFDASPIPNQEVLIGKMGSSNYFSKIDLSKGYWQIPMDETSKPLTAFNTEEGVYQFRRMPFGLVNSGAVFCRMIRKLLDGIKNVESYVDDIIVHTKDWKTHMEVLEQIFGKLKTHNLTVRPTKCEIGARCVEILGHKVGEGDLRPQAVKVNKVLRTEKPTTKKQLRSFLGMIGYYRKFIPNYATIAKELTDMTKKNKPNALIWTNEADFSYNLLKNQISSEPVLKLPRFSEEFILCTDASDVGIGDALMQEMDGVKFPVLYISRKHNKAEQNYAVIEKECLAITWAIKKCTCNYLEQSLH